MKKVMIAASLALMMATQVSFAQAVQKGKEAKKDMKAEKKVAKARELETNARTGKGLEVAGVSDPETRMNKAEKKMDKAQKKAMKADAKGLKATAKGKTKKADRVD